MFASNSNILCSDRSLHDGVDYLMEIGIGCYSGSAYYRLLLLQKLLLKNMTEKAMKSQDESSKLAAEAVTNLLTVTAFSSQTRILKMHEMTQKAPMHESIRQAWYAGFGLALS